MRVRFVFLFAAILVFSVQTPLRADYIHYKDSKGVSHFTDDIGEVPEEFRTEVEKITIYDSEPPAPGTPKVKPRGKNPKKDKPSGPSGGMNRIGKTLNDLKGDKHDLDIMHKGLQEEQTKLSLIREKAVTPQEFLVYNRAVANFNIKVKKYEALRAEYQKRAEALNDAMGY